MEVDFMAFREQWLNKWKIITGLLLIASCYFEPIQTSKITYWENGKMRLFAQYRNGNYHGKVYEWAPNGKMYHMGNYENGQESGLQKLYYENGKIRANYVVHNGRKFGLAGTKNCRKL
jgi:antitoxin component YwqK of YwqJK toxin-antitoxin module